MRSVFLMVSSVLDALLPPAPDVVLARALNEEALGRLLSPRSAGPATTLFPYRDERVRALIRAIKYRGDTRTLPRVGVFLGEYVLAMLAEKRMLAGWKNPLIVPVPSSPERLKARGYNQAERIAEAMLPHIPEARFAPHILSREERASQVSVAPGERRKNVRGAFFVPDAGPVRGRFIFLIDDVVESGATVEDAMRALRAAGAKDIAAVALAH